MGPRLSRLSLPDLVNILQRALPSRSNRQVEPVREIQSNASVNTPVLTTRRDKHRRSHTRFWRGSRKRNSCSCQIKEDDDYASVFGRVRPDSTQSLPIVSPVRCCRPDYPTPLPPSAEYRLFVENIQIESQNNGSTYCEQTTIAQINSETRVVRCRHCRNGVSSSSSTASSPCATPIPTPTSHPVCRACYWHNLLPHDCGCFGPPVPVLSWDTDNIRFKRELSTPILPSRGTPRTRYSDVTPGPEKPKKEEDSPDRKDRFIKSDQDDSVIKPDPTSGPQSVQEPESSETSPCVCAFPSKTACPCDKRLFEAMNPWNTVKTVIFLFLIFALIAWIVSLIIVG